MIIELQKGEDIQTVLNRISRKVIVDVYAKWCGPCKMLETQLQAFTNAHPDWSVLRVDSDVHSEAAAQYGIHAVPTMFIVIDGTATERIIGYKSLAEIENITKKY